MRDGIVNCDPESNMWFDVSEDGAKEILLDYLKIKEAT